jgi:chromosome partitioning protein
MKRLVIFNCKGGVGKTTTVLNLAAAAARDGKKVLLLDLDPQAHLTRTWAEVPRDAADSLFGFFQEVRSLSALQQPWPNVGSIIPAHGQLIKVDTIYGKGPAALNKLRIGIEALAAKEGSAGSQITLLDCCPYTGVLSLNALFAADAVLVPVSTDYLSLDAATQIAQTLSALETVMRRRLPRRYVLTRFDRRRKMSMDVRERLLARFGDEVCTTVIAENVAVAESPSRKMDVFSHQASSAGAQDYLALHRELAAAGLL